MIVDLDLLLDFYEGIEFPDEDVLDALTYPSEGIYRWEGKEWERSGSAPIISPNFISDFDVWVSRTGSNFEYEQHCSACGVSLEIRYHIWHKVKKPILFCIFCFGEINLNLKRNIL